MSTQENELKIEGGKMTIKGNIMILDQLIVQLSNVSCITSQGLRRIPFPFASLIIVLIGIILMSREQMWGIAVIAAGVAWIIVWYKKNNERLLHTYLNIIMNSGDNIRILFTSKIFLENVLTVLGKIIQNGGVGDQQFISINVSGNNFEGNADLLNRLNINK